MAASMLEDDCSRLTDFFLLQALHGIKPSRMKSNHTDLKIAHKLNQKKQPTQQTTNERRQSPQPKLESLRLQKLEGGFRRASRRLQSPSEGGFKGGLKGLKGLKGASRGPGRGDCRCSFVVCWIRCLFWLGLWAIFMSVRFAFLRTALDAVLRLEKETSSSWV